MDLLTVVRQCHNDDPWSDSSLTPFLIEKAGTQIGFLQSVVVQAIQDDIQHGRSYALCVADDAKSVWINANLTSREARSDTLNAIVTSWRDRNLFPDPLKGWRNEQYSIFAPSHVEAFRLERSACALFGVATYGVHATAYTPDYDIWVPRRARDKSTWPGYLDNSVAGGITAGDAPYESMVRECGEEAGLEAKFVCNIMQQTGVISYFYRTPSGWCQPEVEYTYDIALRSTEEKLYPADGEAESFELMDKPQIMQLLREGKFKPNCALVLIDFFIRHGQLTVEDCGSSEDYTELVCSLHNKLRLPAPSWPVKRTYDY